MGLQVKCSPTDSSLPKSRYTDRDWVTPPMTSIYALTRLVIDRVIRGATSRSGVIQGTLPALLKVIGPKLRRPCFGLDRMRPELLELLVTREMPFGKFKGRLIADLPGYYLAWFAREGFPPGQIGQLLALMYELDHNDLRALVEPLRKR